MPVVGFVTMLADGGLGMSLAREPELPALPVDRLSGPCCSPASCSVVCYGLWFVEGRVLHQPRVPALMAALSVTVVLMTVSVPSLARLDRQGRIEVGAFADLAGNLLGVGIGVALAFHGAGGWSLVAISPAVRRAQCHYQQRGVCSRRRFDSDLRLLLPEIPTGSLVMGTRLADYSARTTESCLAG